MFRKILPREVNKNSDAQRLANPCTPVRFRYSPPFNINGLTKFGKSRDDLPTQTPTHSRFVFVPFWAWVFKSCRAYQKTANPQQNMTQCVTRLKIGAHCFAMGIFQCVTRKGER